MNLLLSRLDEQRRWYAAVESAKVVDSRPSGGVGVQPLPPRRPGAGGGLVIGPPPGGKPHPGAHALTANFTASVAQWPDLRNGRGMGCAWPLPSTARQRRV